MELSAGELEFDLDRGKGGRILQGPRDTPDRRPSGCPFGYFHRSDDFYVWVATKGKRRGSFDRSEDFTDVIDEVLDEEEMHRFRRESEKDIYYLSSAGWTHEDIAIVKGISRGQVTKILNSA